MENIAKNQQIKNPSRPYLSGAQIQQAIIPFILISSANDIK